MHKGANPGAFIDSMLKHGEMSDDEAIIYTGMPLCLSHSAESKDDPEDEEKKKDSKEDKSAENKEEKKDNEETIADVIDSMSGEAAECHVCTYRTGSRRRTRKGIQGRFRQQI